MASYRKKINIAPGINMNVSKSGVSTSIGGKGFSVTSGEKGTYVNTSITGTGIYDRKNISRATLNNGSNEHSSLFGYAILFVVALIAVLILTILFAI